MDDRLTDTPLQQPQPAPIAPPLLALLLGPIRGPCVQHQILRMLQFSKAVLPLAGYRLPAGLFAPPPPPGAGELVEET